MLKIVHPVCPEDKKIEREGKHKQTWSMFREIEDGDDVDRVI